MLKPLQTTLSSLEILVQIIFNQYFFNSRCLTIVSEGSLRLNVSISYIYITPRTNGNSQNNECLVQQLLEVSEMGCSDFIVQMREPESFVIAFETVTHLGKIRRSDKKILFIPFDDEDDGNILLNILTREETKFIANVLLVVPTTENITECNSYHLVTHKFVGIQDADIKKPVYLDRWNSCNGNFERKVSLFPHNMTNLQGKTVKVACFTYKPYVLLDLDTSVNPLGRDGMEMRIIDEFCRWINCTVEIIRDDVHQWGEIYANKTGVGVIGNVLEDRADMGITALYSWYEEWVELDFAAPYIRTAITCVAPAARLLPSWELPFLPFTEFVWLALFFTFFYAAIALTMARGCNVDKVFLTTWGMMITQTQDNVGSSWRIRSITAWLLITGLVLDNAYSGGLASTFTVPKYEKSIDTVQDMVDRKMEWGATHDAWIFSLLLSQEPLVKQLVSQFRIYPNEVLKQKSFTRAMAFSIEKLPAGYFAIGEYISKEAMLDLELMVDDFYYEQCVTMLRKNSPYTDKISKLVGRLHESGLILAWETQVALKYLNYKVMLEVKLSRSRRDVDSVNGLSSRQVVGIFIIYFTGVIIATIIFIGEKISYKRRVSNVNE